MNKTVTNRPNGKLVLVALSIFYQLLFSAAAQAQDIWTQKANGMGGSADGAVAIGSKGYVMDQGSLYEYDPGSNSWTQKASFPGTARQEWTTFSVGTKGYWCLGDSNNVPFNDVWEYDQANDTWTQKANLPAAARFLAVGFSIGNKGYACGGYDGTTGFDELWEYNPGNDTWTQRADFPPGPRAAGTGFAVNGKGYFGLGATAAVTDSMKLDFWEYDPGGNSWAQKASFPGQKRVNATAFSIGMLGYAGTGATQIMGSGGNVNDFWEYNPQTDTWTQRTSYAGAGKRNCVSFAIGTKGYLGFGEDQSGPNLVDFWEYTPIPVSVSQVASQTAPEVYPNPNNGTFTIGAPNDGYLSIFDATGKEVATKTIEYKGQHTIQLGQQPNGVYFYRLNTAEGTASGRFLISK